MPDPKTARIHAAAERGRAAIEAADAAAQRKVVATYARAIADTQRKLDAVLRRMAAEATPGRQFQAERLSILLDNLKAELAKAADDVSPAIEAAVRRSQQAAAETSRAMLNAAAGAAPDPSKMAGVFADVASEAVEQAIATVLDAGATAGLPTSPVADLLQRLAGETADKVGETITAGIAQGRNPLLTARMVRTDLGVPLHRAQTITRTETLRSFRESSRSIYQGSGVVDGWTWLSAADGRTCAACFAQHGKTFELAEPMPAHPRCRCTMVPKLTDDVLPNVKGPDIPKGSDLFDAAPESLQRAVLGPSKFAAYQDGAVSLDDLVKTRWDNAYGATVTEKGLTEAIGKDRADSYFRQAAAQGQDVVTAAKTVEGIDDGVGGVITEAEIEAELRRRFSPDVIARNPIEDLRRSVIEDLKKRRATDAARKSLGQGRLDAGRVALEDDVVKSTVRSAMTDAHAQAVRDAERFLTEELKLDPDRLPRRIEWRGLKGSNGQWDPGRRVISIDPRQVDPERARQVFFHEFGHFMDYTYGSSGPIFRVGERVKAARTLLDAMGGTAGNRLSRVLAGLDNYRRRVMRPYYRYLRSDVEYLARATEMHLTILYEGGLDKFFARLVGDGGDGSLYGSRFWTREEYERAGARLVEEWLKEMGVR